MSAHRLRLVGFLLWYTPRMAKPPKMTEDELSLLEMYRDMKHRELAQAELVFKIIRYARIDPEFRRELRVLLGLLKS